jgi:arginyl-tRNA synthetase
VIWKFQLPSQVVRVDKTSISENQEARIKNEEVRNLEKEELELLRFLTQYPYHVTMAAQDFAPNLLCNYLFELSQKYNLFYQKCKIIGGENEAFRLMLTKAVGNVLKNGLTILGIETVEKM